MIAFQATLFVVLIVHGTAAFSGGWYRGQEHTPAHSGEWSGQANGRNYGYPNAGTGWSDRTQPRLDYPGPSTYQVPTTQGYKFRALDDAPRKADNLPRFRPSTFNGNSPYSWGSTDDRWPESYVGPAPVFRPLDSNDRKNRRGRRSGSKALSGYDHTGVPMPFGQIDPAAGDFDYYEGTGYGYVPEW
ncbi:MAG: hypothetical protein GY703_16550 [Gammaproteobacteria bacterium]|nr:hypothetical protein [Gammaproteobacteria bacterium]